MNLSWEFSSFGIFRTSSKLLSKAQIYIHVHVQLLYLCTGAERLVKHLRNHGIPIATATGSHTQSFQLKTSSHKDLFSLFHHSVLSGDDPECKHGKPAPDCFLLAAQRFPDNPHPSKVRGSSNFTSVIQPFMWNP